LLDEDQAQRPRGTVAFPISLAWCVIVVVEADTAWTGGRDRGPGVPGALRALERAFDLVFRAVANPWRHLGALGFFFFWVATASGIYLYLFFDTSVTGAYESVERLTHGQWYAGGVVRSLHRYASGAMVATVALHFVKELVGRRFAGFRWFSWVSGVPLVWLLLASGITGYWLVWDRLAQFVAMATAEWFDALPLFGEPIARNFAFPAAVSDRFFTLIMFLHVALPLALLAGMFVHIQRVNYADVLPARALGWGAFLALLALALAKPALSQGAADLATEPQTLALDWLVLGFYPLIYRFSPEALWIVAAAATLGLLILPFAARGERVPVARVDLANCNGCARCFADCPYAAIVMQPRAGGKAGQKHAAVVAGLCAGCGICTGACPSSTPFRSSERLVTGVDMPQQPIDAVRAELERKLARLHGEGRVVVFGCEQAAALHGCAGRGAATLSLTCVGQLPPAFVEYALRHGADGVLVASCLEGECVYRIGDTWTAQRLAGEREPHLRVTVPRERLRVVRAGAGEEKTLAQALTRFREALARMPRNEPRGSSRSKAPRALAAAQTGARG